MQLSDDNRRIRKVVAQTVALMATVLAAGTIGYRWLEGWSWLDSAYMTVITLATIGYGEIHPLGDVGRVFTIGLILVGVSTLGYALAEMTAFFAGGGLRAYRHRERMEKMLHNLRNHTVICGCGRLGSSVALELHAKRMPFVVVDRDRHAFDKLHLDRDVPFVQGDANDDEVLLQAGVQRALTLVAALNDDAHNVFLTLSARVLTRDTNPNLVIHGKAEDPATLQKLERAGATHAFSPSRVLGHRIALQIVRPAITDLIELASRKGEVELGIEEIAPERIGALGQALAQTPLWGNPGILVLAVRKSDGSLVFPPQSREVLQQGDRVVVMARAETLQALAEGK
jgi:voltage-gated potassium channel